MADLSAEIGGVRIDPAIMVASGIYCFPPSFEGIMDYLGAAVTKSIGPYPRDGNETPVFSRDMNAMGLPNPGSKAFAREMSEHYPMKKPVIISVFGNSEDEVYEVASDVEPYCDALELNISCPNIEAGEKTGITIGSDPKLTFLYTQAARSATDKPLIVKLSPAPYIFDRGLFLEIVDAAVQGRIEGISAINTVPGAMRINVDEGHPVLTARYGGLSGEGIRPIGVGCVYTIYEHLKKCMLEEDIPIIGIGGVSLLEPDTALEYFMAGASAVAFGTDAKNKNTSRLNDSLERFLEKMGERLDELECGSLREIRGKAHEH